MVLVMHLYFNTVIGLMKIATDHANCADQQKIGTSTSPLGFYAQS